jgi:hypothetical protein
MPRKVSVPKSPEVALDADRVISPEVLEGVNRSAIIENTLLPPEKRSGISRQSITTDEKGLAYIANVNARVLRSPSINWEKVAAAIFGLLTFLFFAGLVIASIGGRSVPPDSRLLVMAVLAIGIALSLGFLSGTALVSGNLGKMPLGIDPIAFKAGGGIAVFLIVFLVGYIAYVRNGEESVILQGTVVDANTSKGISSATIVIKTDSNTYERQVTDNGDFRVSDIPHLFNQQISISAKADNFRVAKSQSVILGSYIQHFNLQMYSCYDGDWNEQSSLPSKNGSKWHFKLTGSALHIARLDGLVRGDLHRGNDGNWMGQLVWDSPNKTTDILLYSPNDKCDQILSNQSWSYSRYSFE